MEKTLGVLAHVDAGKTTFCEQLLYRAGSLRKTGRVDHGDAFLDSHALERERGITIFAGQAEFSYGNSRYHLVDTPGHADFSAEMERRLTILDCAVLVVSCVEGVQAHTATIWRLLRRYHIPTFLFLNKTDRAGADPQGVLEELRRKLSPEIWDFSRDYRDGLFTGALAERLALTDEALLEAYLEGEQDPALWRRAVCAQVGEGTLFPCLPGSALLGEGIAGFLELLDRFLRTDYRADGPPVVRIYQVRHDSQGNRLCHGKVQSGTLRVKGELGGEKVDQLRICHGDRHTVVQEIPAGGLCAMVGLRTAQAGDLLTPAGRTSQTKWELTPLLTSKVLFDSALPARTVLEWFRELEDEEPELSVSWEEALGQLKVSVMGEIQLEILKELIAGRYGAPVDFGPCEILYQETIARPVTGYGHFEPLRHYAEVHLRLSPGERGTGVTFESACSTDLLDQNYQNLIRTHVLERRHKGVLTGSPLTDVKVTLLTGRAHLKHTEGGDFREAVYRAVRQGLMQAESLLLEPWYRLELEVPVEQIGRAISDIQKMSGTLETPEQDQNRALLRGEAPAARLLGYSRELNAYTRGTGRLGLLFAGYRPCHNPEEVVSRLAYDCERDTDNPSDSVFCSHGAGFHVPWDQVESHLHCHTKGVD